MTNVNFGLLSWAFTICSDVLPGILVPIPPGIPFDFFLTSYTSNEKSMNYDLPEALTL